MNLAKAELAAHVGSGKEVSDVGSAEFWALAKRMISKGASDLELAHIMSEFRETGNVEIDLDAPKPKTGELTIQLPGPLASTEVLTSIGMTENEINEVQQEVSQFASLRKLKKRGAEHDSGKYQEIGESLEKRLLNLWPRIASSKTRERALKVDWADTTSAGATQNEREAALKFDFCPVSVVEHLVDGQLMFKGSFAGKVKGKKVKVEKVGPTIKETKMRVRVEIAKQVG